MVMLVYQRVYIYIWYIDTYGFDIDTYGFGDPPF